MIRWLRAATLILVSVAGLCLLGPLAPSGQAPLAQNPSGNAPPVGGQRTLVFAGDVMLSRGVGSLMKARNDWAYPFREVVETLHEADLAFCNLECPVSDQGRNQHHLYSFRADPRSLEGLKQAGFNVVSQANNHAFDWGPAALLDSVERLRGAGILTVGAGQNDLEAHYPTLVDVGGPPSGARRAQEGPPSRPERDPGDRSALGPEGGSGPAFAGGSTAGRSQGGLKVGFLAYVNIEPKEATAGIDRPGVAWLEPERVLADIRFARPLVDVLVVCPHWGVEYASQPTPEQVRLAHQMIDAGAGLIVGSHPHVVQPLEQYRGRWIAYSLGNFVFDQKNPATHRGLMLKVTVRDKQVATVTLVPITINGNLQATLAPTVREAPRIVLTGRKLGATSAQ